jgi:hypothetical protein
MKKKLNEENSIMCVRKLTVREVTILSVKALRNEAEKRS